MPGLSAGLDSLPYVLNSLYDKNSCFIGKGAIDKVIH